jgi:hypothetical protein
MYQRFGETWYVHLQGKIFLPENEDNWFLGKIVKIYQTTLYLSSTTAAVDVGSVCVCVCV